MPRMKSVKYSVITGCGKRMHIVSKRFKFWLTHARREKKIDDGWDTCTGFCPACKYVDRCFRMLEDLEFIEKM